MQHALHYDPRISFMIIFLKVFITYHIFFQYPHEYWICVMCVVIFASFNLFPNSNVST